MCSSRHGPGWWHVLHHRHLLGWRAPGHCIRALFFGPIWSPGVWRILFFVPSVTLKSLFLIPEELAGVGPRASAPHSGRVLRRSPQTCARTRPALLPWCPVRSAARPGAAGKADAAAKPSPKGQAPLPPAGAWPFGKEFKDPGVVSGDQALWAHRHSPSGGCSPAAGLPPGPAPRQHLVPSGPPATAPAWGVA